MEIVDLPRVTEIYKKIVNKWQVLKKDWTINLIDKCDQVEMEIIPHGSTENKEQANSGINSLGLHWTLKRKR